MSLAEKQADQKKLAIAVATSIYHYKWIARAVGIAERTLENWRKDDQAFCDGLEQARAEFINKNMRKAKPDFLLQTADRETFGIKQEVELSGNVVQDILKGYGLKGESDDRKADGTVDRPSQD